MNIDKVKSSKSTFLLKQSPRKDYMIIAIIIILLLLTSISGLFVSRLLYPVEELRNSFVSTDIINLLIVLPLLISGYILVNRNCLIGLTFYIGSLFVIIYHYIAYASAFSITFQFILYISLIGFCILEIIRLIRSLDLYKIKEEIAIAIPVRLIAGVLIILGLLFLLRAGNTIIKAFMEVKRFPST
ncbi:MAG: hypothetical protein NUV32_09125 [Exilispira sp.]|jgi:hypothetical protein|nr:hypothetical protein [Exilispira sp.]